MLHASIALLSTEEQAGNIFQKNTLLCSTLLMMTDSVVFHCPNCEMGFHSSRLLEKHMERFCIGRETATYHQPQASKPKRHNLRNLEDEEYKQQGPGLRSLDSTGGVSNSQTLKKLTEEFQKLRMSLEDTLPTFRMLQTKNDNTQQILHQQEYWQRQQQMAEMHERQLADIQARNQHLEQQKNEIHKRLEELKLGNSTTSHIEQLLVELNTQEGKNQLALNALREQVGLLQVAAENRSKPEHPTMIKSDNATDKAEDKVFFKSMPFPPAVGPLSSEIQSVYLAYVQSGGSDHNILRQMYELQVEAVGLEKTEARPEHKGRKKKHESSPSAFSRGLDAELLSVELENQRLEDEILKLKILKDRRRMEDGRWSAYTAVVEPKITA
ncbi:coiled-coil domain-containing protein 17-like [Sceloporus undulatus]|uniref:coiled-coil domain-containing protein 17-like n=1 Tax=Sceloporus undulatus TaxID=8520 RepID=UPI001C4CBB48|nr:coiled-coil domain-containing protein 17-like [Sceloporus undulatus]